MLKLQNKFKYHFVQSWWVYLFVALFFAAGIVFGSLGVAALNESQTTFLLTFLNDNIQDIQGGAMGLSETIKQSVWSNLITLLKIAVLGLTVIGFPLVLAIIFSRGFTLGFTIGFLFQQKSWQGIILILLSIIPSKLILIPTMLVAAVIAINFSFLLIRGGEVRKKTISRQVLSYCMIMLVLSTVVMTAGLLEGYSLPVTTKILGW